MKDSAGTEITEEDIKKEGLLFAPISLQEHIVTWRRDGLKLSEIWSRIRRITYPIHEGYYAQLIQDCLADEKAKEEAEKNEQPRPASQNISTDARPEEWPD